LNKDQDTNTDKLNFEEESKKPVTNLLRQDPEVPLFLKTGSEGKKGNAQDEKDNSEE
jgi:hypothetical protein